MTTYGPEVSTALTARLAERDLDDGDSWRETPEPPSHSFDRPQWSEKRQDEAHRSNSLRESFRRAAATEEKREQVTPSAPPLSDPDASSDRLRKHARLLPVNG